MWTPGTQNFPVMLNWNKKSIAKIKFEVAMQRYFSVVTWSVQYFYIYNAQFSISWLHMASKHLTSHQTETKYL